jgi:O-antigen/teichoic acid export membrane protein
LWIHLQSGLQAAKLPRLQGILLALERGNALVVVCALASLRRLSPHSVFMVFVATPLPSCALALWHLRRLVFPIRRPPMAMVKKMLVFSAPLIPTALAGYMSTNYLDAFFINHYLSSGPVAIYHVAYQFAGLATQIPTLAGALIMPLFLTMYVRGRTGEMLEFFKRVVPILVLAWSVVCSLTAAVGAVVLPAVFGRQMAQVSVLTWPFMAGAALAAPTLLGYASIAHVRGDTYLAMINGIVCAAMNVSLDALLIPRFGIVGCARATTGAYLCCSLVLAFLIHRRVPETRSWAIEASLPPIAGAAYALEAGPGIGALMSSLVATAIVAVRHFGAIREGVAFVLDVARRSPSRATLRAS